MRKILILFFFIITCAELSAQNYYLRSLDLDTGANFTVTPYFNKATYECVVSSSTLLLDTLDAYNKFVFRTHFTKLDSTNNIVVDKSFILKNSSIRIRGVIKLMQGGYLGYGLYYDSKSLKNNTAGIPGCIIQYNENGDTVRTKKFPFRKDVSEILSLLQLPDTSLIISSLLCDTNGSFSNYNALRVVKLNKNLGIVWDSTFYFGYKVDVEVPRTAGYINAIVQTSDNGFFIGTSVYLDVADPEYHATVFKIDSNGRFKWENNFYGNDKLSLINKIIRLRDGNYLLVGDFEDYDQTPPYIDNFIIVIKMNELGRVLWKKLVYKYEYQFIYDVDEFPNGNILLAGQTDVVNINIGYDPKGALICLDDSGNILWDRQYDVPSNKVYDEIVDVYLSDVTIANDNSILGIGNITISDSSFPFNGGNDQDLLFLHADSLGCIMPGTCPITNVETLPQEPNYFYAYPNPTSNHISFKSNLSLTSNIQIKMFNGIGQMILQKTLSDFNESIDVNDFAIGIYFVELSDDNFVGTQKVVVE